MIIKRIDFETILPIWQEKLWPGRPSAIESHSCMTWPFEDNPDLYDIAIFDFEPLFLGVYIGDQLIGTGSGHRSSTHQYRMRGFWVDPDYRNQGILHNMLTTIEDQGILEGCNMIWGIPRKSSLPAYQKFGFETVGDFFKTETAELNIYAVKILHSAYL